MWTIDSTRIYAQKLNEETKQIIPRLQPVGGGTVLQIFGYDSDIYKLAGKVVGYTDHDAIKAMANDGNTHTVTESGGWTKTVYVSNFSSSRDSAITQTMRTDLSCYAPVFTVELELFDGS
jgi:hypothetical protein